MKLTLMITLLTFLVSGVYSSNTECKYVGEIRVGDRFNTMPKSIIEKSVQDELKNLSGDKYEIYYTSHKHGKLGVGYTANAKIFKCGK